MPAKIFKFGLEAKAKLLEGVNITTDSVASTLGPKGNNVAIDRKWGAPIVVHDGVTVAKEVDLEDPFENMGAQLIKEAAQKTNDAAGDGTTTATILAQSIVNEALKLIAAGSNAMMIRRGIEKAVNALVEQLGKLSKKVTTPEEVTQVATISAQDESIGKLISNAIEKVGNDGVVTVEESGTTSELNVEYKEGMEFDRGFISPYFLTDQQLGESTVQKAHILITDKVLSNMQEFLPFLQKFVQAQKEPGWGPNLVVIGDRIDGEVLATLIVNKVKGILNVCAVQAPAYGDKRKEILQDIAVVTGGKFIGEETGTKLDSLELSDLGRAARVTSTKDSTLIVDGQGSKEAIKERINSLKRGLEKMETNEFDKEKMRERLAKLSTGIAVINVGANSEAEMREKKERCIDAINATKAAIDEGIVPGGEIALIRAASQIKLPDSSNPDENAGVRMVLKAIEEPFRRLMKNAALDEGKSLLKIEQVTNINEGIDVIDGETKDLVKAGIIDPVKVTRSALQNAASTAIMITTTDVLITEAPQELKPEKPIRTETPAY